MDALERQAVAVFNGSRTGELLADKLMSHHAFEAGGVPVPPLSESSGFVRSRAGTRLETFVERGDDGGRFSDDSQIRTAFVDTVIDFENRSYFTTVRLVCVDDIILHAYPRARDVQERNASVHASNTPLNPPLIEFLQEKLVDTKSEELSRVARELFSVLGHGFYAHDLLIDRRDGSVSVCESGFKFYDNAYHDRMEPIAADLPSQAVLFPVEAFARLSAHAFVARCDGVLAQRD